MTNTIRNVTMDEIVFMTSCHVSLNPNRGPATSQPAINMTAALNANGWPLKRAKACANREYHEDFSTIVDPIGFSRDAACRRRDRSGFMQTRKIASSEMRAERSDQRSPSMPRKCRSAARNGPSAPDRFGGRPYHDKAETAQV